jgi:hypothetical protein
MPSSGAPGDPPNPSGREVELQRSFHIEGSHGPRPSAREVIYCDGGTDDHFREGVDLQLSHWIERLAKAYCL